MKRQLKLTLCLLAGILFFSATVKAQGSGTGGAQHLIDSLKITDADEIAICNLYDDAVTECLKIYKDYAANGTKPTSAQSAEITKRFQQRQKEIQPQIESFRKKIAANYPQLMTFAYFCNYENMRIFGLMMPNGMSQYPKGAYPGYPMPANH